MAKAVTMSASSRWNHIQAARWPGISVTSRYDNLLRRTERGRSMIMSYSRPAGNAHFGLVVADLIVIVLLAELAS